MRISIMADKVHFTLPIPVSLVTLMAPIAINCIPDNKLPQNLKSYVAKAIPDIVDNIKEYRGMTIVDVKTAKGEKVLIKV